MQETIIIAGLAIIAYLYVKHKKRIGQELMIAALMSATWVGLSGIYTYSDAHIVIGGLNVFPFVVWTAGLVILREFYESKKGPHKYRDTVIVYVAALLVLEYVGYNMLGIRLATNYPGLFGIELMHMPWWAQTYYLLAGPIYIKLTDYAMVK